MKHWHLQMLKPYGNESEVRTDARQMLHEPAPIIGMGEWEDDKKQCRNFKSVPIGTIVLVREGQRAIALCEVLDDNFKDEALEAKYYHCNFRHVRVLQWAEDYHQPDNQLFSQGTFLACNEWTAQYKYIQDWIDNINMNAKLSLITKLLREKKNIILQGAPGTGKTYSTAALALSVIGVDNVNYADRASVMKEYNRRLKAGQIFFTTFHQSMDYEDFVEGIRPIMKENSVIYDVRQGIFRKACVAAKAKSLTPVQCVDRFVQNLSDNEEDAIVIPTKSDRSELRVWHVEGAKTIMVRSVKSVSKQGYAPLNIKKVRLQADGVEKGENNWTAYADAVISASIEEYGKEDRPVVLIIDEINRGNISKILGELITLLEADKREGTENAISTILPYSGDEFSVPSNFYIIGTMNTTDRSTGAVDYAIRRRFAFVTLMADEKLLEVEYPNSLQLFRAVQKFIEKQTTDTLDMDDLMIGHSYFMTKDLPMAWEYEIRPLLVEYYKDGLLKCLPKGKTIDEFIAKNQD